MTTKDENAELADLERINAELTTSLRRCRALLKDCQSKLAANTNDPPSVDNQGNGKSVEAE